MGQLSENGKSDAFIEPLQTMVRSARRGQRETFISDASLAGTGRLPGAYLQAQRMTLRTTVSSPRQQDGNVKTRSTEPCPPWHSTYATTTRDPRPRVRR